MTVPNSNSKPRLAKRVRSSPAALAAVMLGCVFLASASPPPASAAANVSANATKTGGTVTAGEGASSLETAASKAGDMGRKVAMSLIGLALAVAGIVLAFRRDFKKVAGVLVGGNAGGSARHPDGLERAAEHRHDAVRGLLMGGCGACAQGPVQGSERLSDGDRDPLLPQRVRPGTAHLPGRPRAAEPRLACPCAAPSISPRSCWRGCCWRRLAAGGGARASAALVRARSGHARRRRRAADDGANRRPLLSPRRVVALAAMPWGRAASEPVASRSGRSLIGVRGSWWCFPTAPMRACAACAAAARRRCAWRSRTNAWNGSTASWASSRGVRVWRCASSQGGARPRAVAEHRAAPRNAPTGAVIACARRFASCTATASSRTAWMTAGPRFW